MKEIISEEEVEKAVHYLAESAKDFAGWKSRVEFLKSHKKSVRSAEVLGGKGSTMTENVHIGEASQAYKDILIKYEEAVYEFTLIDAYRKAAEARIEVWRTISSSNRKGHI